MDNGNRLVETCTAGSSSHFSVHCSCSKRYASRVVQDISDKVEILLEAPLIGRVVPEIGEEHVLEISMYSYRIMYELIADIIYIHGILHKRRHLKPEDIQR